MRSAVTTLLLPLLFVTSLVAGFNTRELRNIGGLVHHYRHHVEAHGERDLTFWDFLADHFSGGAKRDDEHRDLPLLGSGTAPVTVAVTVVEADPLGTPTPVHTLERPLEPTPAPLHRPCGRIFQPPRG